MKLSSARYLGLPENSLIFRSKVPWRPPCISARDGRGMRDGASNDRRRPSCVFFSPQSIEGDDSEWGSGRVKEDMMGLAGLLVTIVGFLVAAGSVGIIDSTTGRLG